VAAKYRRIDPRIWHDERFRQLDANGKIIALYILTAQANRIGLFCFSVALAEEDINHFDGQSGKGVPHVISDFKSTFGHVISTMKWAFDEKSRTIYLPNWWKYNLPTSELNMSGCLEDLHDLPANPFMEAFRANEKHLPERFRVILRNIGAQQPQERIEEQEGLQATESKKRSKPPEPRPRDSLFDAVAEVTGSDPKVSGSHVAKVCKNLRLADPPYTPEEVKEWAKHQTWQDGYPTLGYLEKTIGIVRAQPRREAKKELANGKYYSSQRFNGEYR